MNAPKAREIPLDVGQGNSLAFLLNNIFICMLSCIQHETLKKGHSGHDKGRCSYPKGGAKAEFSL